MITIIDYGMGNLKSVYNALKKVNFDCQISSEVTDIEMADKLILPGVGAFKDAMDNLQNLDLILPIRKKVNDGCPLLGICLGMQTAVIEFARNVVGYDNANSYEINPETKYPVIDLMPEQKDIEDLGGTMRLGLYPCKLKEGSKVNECYDDKLIYERHRHRYEFNNEYRKQIISSGMKITGTSPDGRLVEIVELENHPWFVAVQFHPELKSRPNKPHPLFKGFIKASLGDN